MELKINEEYAKKYNNWRQKEELQKLKDKYGNVDANAAESSSDDTSEEEDDNAVELTSNVAKSWLETYAAVRAHDPAIYDQNVKFFNEAEQIDRPSKEQRPFYLRDYERQVVLKHGGIVKESVPVKKSYKEELDAMKDDLAAAAGADDGGEELLTAKKKSAGDLRKEESDYLQWLRESDASAAPAAMSELRSFWGDPGLSEKDRFLRDFIVNKRYLPNGDAEGGASDSDSSSRSDDELMRSKFGQDDVSSDEAALEQQDDFERKYNFRFEEPDAEFIKSYPRTVGDTLRRENDRRVKKRQAVNERRQRAEMQRQEELKQLKNLKKKEIRDRLEQIKLLTGNDQLPLRDADLEGDFDPAGHSQMMQKLFGDEFYAENELEKPEFSELSDDDADWDRYNAVAKTMKKSTKNKKKLKKAAARADLPDCEQGDFSMDADQCTSAAQHVRTSAAPSEFAECIARPKPVFDPQAHTFEQYLDEYYRLDYEDVIGGDTPCRFRYRTVPANDYGLSVEEVLSCADRELNAWVSLKKVVRFGTTEHDERHELKRCQRHARDPTKKLRILTSLAPNTPERDESDSDAVAKQQPSTTTETKAGAAGDSIDQQQTHVADSLTCYGVEQASGSRKRNKHRQYRNPAKMSDDRLAAYGLDPKHVKYTVHKRQKSHPPAAK